MTQPEPEPRGQRLHVPPPTRTAIGLLEPEPGGGRPRRGLPWRRVLLAGAAILAAGAVAAYRVLR